MPATARGAGGSGPPGTSRPPGPALAAGPFAPARAAPVQRGHRRVRAEQTRGRPAAPSAGTGPSPALYQGPVPVVTPRSRFPPAYRATVSVFGLAPAAAYFGLGRPGPWTGGRPLPESAGGGSNRPASGWSMRTGTGRARRRATDRAISRVPWPESATTTRLRPGDRVALDP